MSWPLTWRSRIALCTPGGQFVLVYPEGNSDFAEVCRQYQALLTDHSTLRAVTIEELLVADTLPDGSAAAFRHRYLPCGRN